MTSLITNGTHLIAAVIGFALIYFLSKSDRYKNAFWPVVFALSALIALRVFQTSTPQIYFEDFKSAYWQAARAFLAGPDAIATLYDRGTDGFVNLPIVVIAFAPFGLLSEQAAGIAFFALSGLCVLAIWRLLVHLFALNRFESAACLFALGAFGPLLYSIREGNISHLILAMVLGATVLTRAGKDAQAGVLFGLAAILKPPLALIGIYFFLRGRWRVVIGGAAVCVFIPALSVLLFGWSMHVLWYQNCIVPYAGGPIAAFNVQSVPAAISRLEVGMSSLWDWNIHPLSPLGKAASAALSLVIGLGAIWACLPRGLRAPITQAETEAELYIVLTLACVLSTLTWSHYYVWVIPALALAFRATMPGSGASAYWRWVALGAFVLIAPAEFLSPQMRWGGFGDAALVLTSHMLIGALLLLAVLYKARRAMAGPVA